MNRYLDSLDSGIVLSGSYSPIQWLETVRTYTSPDFLQYVESRAWLPLEWTNNHLQRAVEPLVQEVQRFAVRLCDSTEEFEYLCYDIRALRAYLKSIGTDDASIESACTHILKRKISALSIIRTEFQLYHEAFLDGRVRVEAERPFWEEYPNENH